MTLTISAIILAGGQSTRMGRDKALLELDQRPLIQHVCQVAQAIAHPVFIVTPWIERYQSAVPETCQFIQEALLLDETKPHGPLLGFAQGLAHIRTEWVLLLACDLPRLDAAVLQETVNALESVPEEAIAFLPKNPKGWEPLCGFYRSRCLAELTVYIEQGGRSFQRWLDQAIVAELTLSDPQILFNCNTPDDLVMLEGYHATHDIPSEHHP
jgi:molybdopterin-guanine dinucleotide biosynthesis protein A